MSPHTVPRKVAPPCWHYRHPCACLKTITLLRAALHERCNECEERLK